MCPSQKSPLVGLYQWCSSWPDVQLWVGPWTRSIPTCQDLVPHCLHTATYTMFWVWVSDWPCVLGSGPVSLHDRTGLWYPAQPCTLIGLWDPTLLLPGPGSCPEYLISCAGLVGSPWVQKLPNLSHWNWALGPNTVLPWPSMLSCIPEFMCRAGGFPMGPEIDSKVPFLPCHQMFILVGSLAGQMTQCQRQARGWAFLATCIGNA